MAKYDPNEPTGEKLARLETKVDMLLDGNTDHEQRIRSMEKKQWMFAGIATALGAGASLILNKLGITI